MSKIEWTDKTINPIVGCSKISPACQNCYAERMAKRLQGMGVRGYEKYNPIKDAWDSSIVNNSGWTGLTKFIHSELEKPYRWRKSRKIFVVSMGDLFYLDGGLPIHPVGRVIDTAWRCEQHTFQFLTKRAKEALELFNHGLRPFSPNSWFGITAENQEWLLRRWKYASQIPASVIFISYEPALGPLDISVLDRKPDWIICGGESGPGARLMKPEWVRSLRDQCKAAGVPFFFKQWGEWREFSAKLDIPMSKMRQVVMNDGLTMFKYGKKNAGRLLDGREYNEFPVD